MHLKKRISFSSIHIGAVSKRPYKTLEKLEKIFLWNQCYHTCFTEPNDSRFETPVYKNLETLISRRFQTPIYASKKMHTRFTMPYNGHFETTIYDSKKTRIL